MTKSELTALFGDKIQESPLKDCPRCSGEGLKVRKSGEKVACLCVCLSGCESTRKTLVNAFQETIISIQGELKEQGISHPMVQAAAKIVMLFQKIKSNR